MDATAGSIFTIFSPAQQLKKLASGKPTKISPDSIAFLVWEWPHHFGLRRPPIAEKRLTPQQAEMRRELRDYIRMKPTRFSGPELARTVLDTPERFGFERVG